MSGQIVYYDLKTKQYFTQPGLFGFPSQPEAPLYLPVPTLVTEKVITEVEEVKIPTMPILAGFEKTLMEQLDTLASGIKGVSQPIIYTETPEGMAINWKTIIPIGAVVLFFLLS